MKKIVGAQKIRIGKRRFYTMITQRDDTLVWTVDTPDEMHMLLVFPFLLFVVNFGHFVKFHFTLRSFTIINNLYYTLTTFLPSLYLSIEQYTLSILCARVCKCRKCVLRVFSEYFLTYTRGRQGGVGLSCAT